MRLCKQSIVEFGHDGCKGSWVFQGHPSWEKGGCGPLSMSIVFWLYTASHYRSSMSSILLPSILPGIFHQTQLLSYFWFFPRIKSSCSCVNCSSLKSSWLLIIFVIGSSVTFGDFPSKFSKCFHRSIRSSWLVALSLTFAVLFLLLTSFAVWHATLDCLSSTESLILLIWF